MTNNEKVSMPSRAYTSFLQCYMKRLRLSEQTSVNALSGLYLISTWCKLSVITMSLISVNALSGLYLIST